MKGSCTSTTRRVCWPGFPVPSQRQLDLPFVVNQSRLPGANGGRCATPSPRAAAICTARTTYSSFSRGPSASFFPHAVDAPCFFYSVTDLRSYARIVCVCGIMSRDDAEKKRCGKRFAAALVHVKRGSSQRYVDAQHFLLSAMLQGCFAGKGGLVSRQFRACPGLLCSKFHDRVVAGLAEKDY
jgi:hypothetical protein